MNAIRVMMVAVGLALAANSTHAAEPPEPIVLQGHTMAVSAVAWAADGKAVATAGDDRTIRVWDPATGRQTAIQPETARAGYGSPVVAFTTDLKVAAVNYWGEITIRAVTGDTESVKIDPILDRGERSAFRPDVFAMAFSPDGKRLATAGSVAAVGGPHGLPGGIVIIWDAKTGKLLQKSAKLSTAASSVAWSADGKRFAAGTNGAGGELPEAGQVHVWSAETGKLVHRFHVKPQVKPGEWASAGDVAFDPEGRRIAVPITAGSRGTPAGLLISGTGSSVRVWDLETGEVTQPIEGLKASVRRLAFSPDGKYLATAGGDKVVRVWEVGTGKEVAAWSSPARIEVVAFSPDGTALAAGSKDGAVRIWMVKADN